MARTWFTVLTALLLVAVSLAVLFTRRAILGADINGPRGTSTWKVSLHVGGELPPNVPALITYTPLDFRRQHVYGEQLDSPNLSHKATHGKLTHQREIKWQRLNANAPQPFELTYSVQCSLGMWPTTPGMERTTEAIDAGPTRDSQAGGMPYRRPAYRIESEHRDIQARANSLVVGTMTQADQARALFNFVKNLERQEAPAGQTALECLRAQGGGSAGKSRLLVALCRNRSIPARLVSGLVLNAEGTHSPHYWVEAWVNEYWLPMCPVEGLFGLSALPKNYLVWHIGPEEIVRGRQNTFTYDFTVEKLYEGPAADEDAPAPVASFWQGLSLYTLQPGEQQLVRFLLLLPLAALIVSFFRTVIGVPTFGTFAPALMGMAFLDLKVLPFGLVIFLVIILIGWGLRHLLDRYHLLMVPRVSALLTLIVMVLVSGIAVASHFGIPVTSYMALVPLVILTHLVERFWTVEAEDSTVAAFKTLAGTFGVAVTVSILLSPQPVAIWMFRYPETVGLVLACSLLLGRYTGYRLTELYRFQDLLGEETSTGGTHELDQSLAGAAPPRHHGDEPPQHRVHPGSEPSSAVPAGGRQEADEGFMPGDRRPHA